MNTQEKNTTESKMILRGSSEPSKEPESKPVPLLERLNRLEEEAESRIKKKKLKLPRKAKVRKGKIKKGWLGIIRISENGNISGEKQKLEDGTVRLKDKTYHAVTADEIGLWNGKHPVIILPSWRKNPIKIRQANEANETHGQKYIMARMLGDTIKVKATAK